MKPGEEHINTDNQALKKVFSNHYQSLVVYGNSIISDPVLVEDCIQDLFLKFCENEDLILGAEYKEAYLKTSLRRSLIQKNKDKYKLVGEPKLIEISVPSYEDILIKKQDSLQDSLKIKECFQQLSPSQKTIMTMRFYRSMSYEEIAEKLNVTKRTVYNQVHDAIKKLRVGITK